MAATGRDAPVQSATADREIVISRLISAPRELVFEAFTEVRHLSRWWGPEGFTTTTRAFEFRVCGEWVFVMHGPHGTDLASSGFASESPRGPGARAACVAMAFKLIERPHGMV
ncbi:MAG: SRPBCC domain-containing protein, partial [Steroidobacteraceae bacterium]